MKIGIITMHRVAHFGSVLQAYALQKFLLDNGMDNEIIDYVYPNKLHRKPFKKRLRTFLTKKYHHIINLLTNNRQRDSKSNTVKFIKEELIKSDRTYRSAEELANNPPLYDIYLTGSDQVWNTDYLKGDTTFFCSFAGNESPRISYAASFGRFTFEGEEAHRWLSHIKPYKALSVREKTAKDIIKKYSGLEAEQVVDPTLLLNKENWQEFAGGKPLIEGNYILVYLLVYAWNPFPYALDVVRHFEKETGWKVVVIEPMFRRSDFPGWIYTDNLNPHQFVNLIANAGLVITTSFHGTSFSINMEVPFYSIINRNKVNDDRIKSLCEAVGLHDSLLMAESPMPGFPKPDFGKSTQNLNALRHKSATFLLNAITDNLQSND